LIVLQLSIQDAERAPADAVAGLRAHDRKLTVAALVRQHGLPLTINVVLHCGNVERLFAVAELAAALGADRLELAHTQFYDWGLHNRAILVRSPRWSG
jgi:pyrroloquinoline quinone biosynthesis protein E